MCWLSRVIEIHAHDHHSPYYALVHTRTCYCGIFPNLLIATKYTVVSCYCSTVDGFAINHREHLLDMIFQAWVGVINCACRPTSICTNIVDVTLLNLNNDF